MSAYDSYSDIELIRLLRDGCTDAFTAIHRRYYGILYLHACKKLINSDEVKDVLQELFTCLWNNRNNIEPEVNLKAYLYTATRNRVLNIFKHRKIKTDYILSFQKFIASNEPAPDEMFRIKELKAIIDAGVSELPCQMRLIFEMSRNANLSHQEIARELNISPLTVKKTSEQLPQNSEG